MSKIIKFERPEKPAASKKSDKWRDSDITKEDDDKLITAVKNLDDWLQEFRAVFSKSSTTVEYLDVLDGMKSSIARIENVVFQIEEDSQD